jgi:4-hydroxybenzoate polyprenyltransferase
MTEPTDPSGSTRPSGSPDSSALHVALRLGRVSNVPTVWTNVAAGLALTGAGLRPALLVLLGLAVSLFYVGGMYLNDAFDADWDRRHRPERPIPAGLVQARTVYLAGFAMLAAGLVIIACSTTTRPPLYAALVLCGLIVFYDLSHKNNPLSPLIMALCRVSVYVLAAFAVTPPPLPRGVYLGALALFLYLVFLSTLARKETLHPRLPRMIGSLVAGIALLDAGLLLITGHELASALAVGAFFLTRRLQRSVPGS